MILKTKSFPALYAFGEASGQIILDHVFEENGVITVSDNSGNILTINLPSYGGLTRSENGNVVSYHITGTFQGTTYDVTVSFDFDAKPNGAKIRIVGTASKATQIRLNLNSNKAAKYLSGLRQFWAGTEDYAGRLQSGVGLDWTDVTGITWDFNETSRVLTFNVGTSFSIDPATIGTSSVANATELGGCQRKSFYAASRHWVFYSDGTDVGYRSSANGVDWSNFTTIATSAAGYQITIFWDGTYVHYARSAIDQFYRRGTPVSDGTITWSAVEQTAVDATGSEACEINSMGVDTDGHVYLGYRWYTGSAYYPYITKNNNTDGTWSTAASFPYQLSTTSDQAWRVTLSSLTSNKMYASYVRQNNPVKGQLYNAGWGSEESVSTSSFVNSSHWGISAVNDGDDVHISFKTSTDNLIHIKRTYGVGWGSENTIQSSASSAASVVIGIDPATHKIYAFWVNTPTSNHVYYKIYDGSWGSINDWQTETNITNAYTINCARTVNNYLSVIWLTGTSNPYSVRHAYLTITATYNYFYFRDTDATLGPSGELSPDTDDFPSVPSDKNTIKNMTTTKGVAQTSSGGVYNNAGANKKAFIYFAITPALKACTLVGGQAGYKVATALSESSTNMNLFLRVFAYVYRSGANVKTILAPTSHTTEAATTETGSVVTVTGEPTNFAMLDGDRIVSCSWLDLQNTKSVDYTGTFYYDGTTDPVQGTATSDAASYFYCPQALELSTATLKEVTDSVGLTDTILRDKVLTITDGVGLADTILKDWSGTIADAISLVDAVYRHKPLVEVLDAAALTDTILRDKSFTITDTISLNEVVDVLKQIVKEVMDAIGISDTVLVNKTLTITDLIQTTDAVLVNKALTILDNLSLSDIAAVMKLIFITDSINLTELVDVAKWILKEVTDSIGLSETLKLDKTLTVTDVVGLLDTVLRNKVFTISDNISLTDTVLRNKVLQILDAVGLSEQVLTHKSLIIADSVMAVDTVLASKNLIILDTIGLSDTVLRDKLIFITDTLGLSDAVVVITLVPWPGLYMVLDLKTRTMQLVVSKRDLILELKKKSQELKLRE